MIYVTTWIMEALYIKMGENDFKKWYFGHWHENKEFGKFHCLYNKIEKIC